jgi:hypothetical protein
LLLGQAVEASALPQDAARIELVLNDVASYLESCVPGAFGGFTISNILDGARPDYRDRLVKAMRHAATPNAVVVLRSFGEPTSDIPNEAARDRSMLWGSVHVQPVGLM